MRYAAGVVALCFALSGCQAAAPAMSAEHARALEDSVLAVLEDLRSATNAGDWDQALDLYDRHPRFRWIEDGRVRYTSVAGIAVGLAELDSLFQSAEIEWVDPRAVALAPSVGAVTTGYRQVFTDGEGRRFSLEGAITFTAVHRPEGWRLLLGHTSTRRDR